MSFEFALPTRIVFGPGTFASIGNVVGELGRRALVVGGSRTLEREGVIARLTEHLTATGIASVEFTVDSEPDVATIERGARLARDERSDVVVGIGGGSALDAAKAIAGLATNDGEALDYLEVVGRGKSLTRPALPIVAVPTTAGTGAEVTRNAVILEPSRRYKASVRSAFLYPRVALIDPELARSLSPAVTISTGLDALTQLIESYVSVRANALTDAIARDGMRRAARALPRVASDGRDIEARTEMALASLLSGIALANAGLGAVHGFASPLGGRYPIPHGAACAALLPRIMAVNVRALRERDPNGPGLERYRDVAALLLGESRGSADETIDAGVRWVADLCRDLLVPFLKEYGVRRDDVAGLVEATERASSTRGNPIVLTADEMAGALEAAIG
jgi:alcohol dehydrogenase class IV